MSACGGGKYAVKLAEAFAGMHGRAVQVTTVPDDQQTHDLSISGSRVRRGGPAHRVKTVITAKAPTVRTMTRMPFAVAAPVAPPVPVPASTSPRTRHTLRSRAPASSPVHSSCLPWKPGRAARPPRGDYPRCVAQLKRDALRLTGNGHGGDVSWRGVYWFTRRVRANLGSAGLPGVASPGPESLRDFVW
jgi:hypothetical protein